MLNVMAGFDAHISSRPTRPWGYCLAAWFALGQRNAITVPAAAIVVRDGFSSVFEVTKDSKVRMLRVQTGQRTGDTVEITSGLQPDASIVARGGAFLNDGDLVRVQPAAQ